MDRLCTDSVNSVNLVKSNPWIFQSVNLLIHHRHRQTCLMWRLSRPICHLFCKQAAFKRSLNLCSAHVLTSAGLGLLVLSYIFWCICGWGSFQDVKWISVCPWLIDETDTSTLWSCWFVFCQLDECRVTKSISGFFDRCLSTDSMAGSSKDILYRKHGRLKRKFSYGLVYFTRVYFWKKTTVVLREDLI